MKKALCKQGIRYIGLNSKDNSQQEVCALRTFFNTRLLHIPKSFKLGGLHIHVLVDNTLLPSKGMFAESRYNEQEIAIDIIHAREEFVEQACWHELVHWCLFIMNEDSLKNNERFVDTLAHLLYQSQVTADWQDGCAEVFKTTCDRCGNEMVPFNCIQGGEEVEGRTCDCEIESSLDVDEQF